MLTIAAEIVLGVLALALWPVAIPAAIGYLIGGVPGAVIGALIGLALWGLASD